MDLKLFKTPFLSPTRTSQRPHSRSRGENFLSREAEIVLWSPPLRNNHVKDSTQRGTHRFSTKCHFVAKSTRRKRALCDTLSLATSPAGTLLYRNGQQTVHP